MAGARQSPLLLALALVLPGCLEPECPPETRTVALSSVAEPALRVVTWNIGNGTASPRRYALRIRSQAYEDHVGARLRALDADVVALQEVLAPDRCEGEPEPDPAFACFGAAERPPAVRRLLGADYSIVCDARRQVECLGVHLRLGTIRGVPPGGLVLDGAETAPLPGPPCDYLADACRARKDNCDSESTVSTVVVDTARGPLRVVHVHPTAIGQTCRTRQVRQAFELVDGLPAIVLGDWNFDPEDVADVVDAAVYRAYVGPDRRFAEHHPRGADCRLTGTSAGRRAALDRVVTDFAHGGCVVWRSPPLDDGFAADVPGGRADHYAVQCDLVDDRPVAP